MNDMLPQISFSYHLADHCNLKCKGCDNFSSIASEKYTDMQSFKSDLKRMREIFGSSVKQILLLGGEPLLNNKINDFLFVSRQIFPENDIKIIIITNGTLLSGMNSLFWKCCNRCKIEIGYTEYPFHIKWEHIKKKAVDYGVEIHKYNKEKEKTLQFIPFDLTGTQDIEENFKNCFHANRCIQLFNGKLYTCNIRAYAYIFCEKYNVDFQFSDQDYVNIYDNYNAQDIVDFLAQPIPFCRFCNIKKRDENHVWRLTGNKCTMYDWLVLDEMGIQKYIMKSFKKVVAVVRNKDIDYYTELFSKGVKLECIKVDDRGIITRCIFADLVKRVFNDPLELISDSKEAGFIIISSDKQWSLKVEKILIDEGFLNVFIYDVGEKTE